MAVAHGGSMTFLNGEAAAMKPYRRVKLDTNNLGKILYADAADGDGWIGVTLPMEGGDAAVGGRQTVALRTQNATFKIEASAEVVQAVACYPENDGKISDDAGTVVIGTAMSGGAGAGSIVEFLPAAAAGAGIMGDNIVNADLDGAGGMPLIFGKTVTFTAGAGLTQLLATLTRKVRIIDYWLIARDTTAANIKLNDGSADVTADLAKGTSDNAIVRGTNLIAAKDEIAAEGTIKAIASAACACDVWVLCVPIA